MSMDPDRDGGAELPPTDASTSLIASFGHLALHEKWKKNSSEYRAHRADFVRGQFEATFGSNTSDLAGWQALCRAVGVAAAAVPASITQCKKLLRKVNVNIYDVIDAARSGAVARTFPNAALLAAYTQSSGKVFPKQAAKTNRLLKFMLRHLFG